jgi:Mrp family chromosome partitioning ATPase
MHIALTLAAVLGILFAAAGYLYGKQHYQSTAMIEVKTIIVNANGETLNRTHSLDPLKNAEIETIRSNRVRNLVTSDPEFIQRTEGRYETPEGRERFASRINFRTDRGNPTIRISFTDTTQDDAHFALSKLMAAYFQVLQEDNRAGYRGRIELLQQSLIQLRSQNASDQAQLTGFTDEFGTSDLESLLATKTGRMEALQGDLDAINLRLQAVRAEGGGDDNPFALDLVNLANLDPQLAQLLENRSALQREMELNSQRGAGHPEVRRLQRELEATDAQIEARVRDLQENPPDPGTAGGVNVFNSVAGLEAQQATLEAELDNLQAEVRRISRAKVTVTETNAAIQRRQTNITTYENQIRMMDVRARDELPVLVVSDATIPAYPSNSGDKPKRAILGFAAGVGMGFAAVMLLGLIDSRVRRAEDVIEQMPAAKLLGMLPTLPDNLKDRQVAQLTSSSVHHIRTLLQVATTPDRRVMTFTSPAAGSGKTSVTLATALSFAASRNRVLVIDLDVISGETTRRCTDLVRSMLGPVLHERGLISAELMREAERASESSGQRLDDLIVERGYVSEEDMAAIIDLGGPDSIGLLDACNGAALDDCVSPTGVPGMHVLPVGSATPEEAGSLSPGEVADLIERAREQYDVVLIDTGPLLGSLEAAMAATHSAGVVLVVSRGDDRKLTQEVVSKIDSINANLLGMVFNHAVIEDLERSSYWATSSIQNRKSDAEQHEGLIPQRAARGLGPLAMAVAKYTQLKQRRSPSPKRQPPKGGMNLAS